MKTSVLFVGIFLASVSLVFAQDRRFDISGAGDCLDAIPISTLRDFGPTTTPEGHGKVMEFNGNHRRSLFYIQREHNTVWYKFKAARTGLLAFEIIPVNPTNDYDFMLYRFEGRSFCRSLAAKRIQPVRTNMSRVSAAVEGRTGLDKHSDEPLVSGGIGNPYSTAMEVQKGEIYYLLVDNVSSRPAGHTIRFKYSKDSYEIKGQVCDKVVGTGVNADVYLRDLTTGKLVARTNADSATGKFNLTIADDISLHPKAKYSLQVMKDGYFFSDTIINAVDLPSMRGREMQHELPQLKIGASFHLDNILFFGASTRPLAESYQIFDMLYRVMAKNQGLRIEIQGHTNGCPRGEKHSLNLSRSRAKAVSDILIRRGINRSRIKTTGYGCEKMIYPLNEALEDDAKAKMNRRVEVVVLDYKN